MAKLWQRLHTRSGPELREADISTIRIDTPTLLFLPGVFTTNSKQHHVAEGLDDIGNLLLRHGETLPRMLAISHDDLANIFNLAAYNGNPDKAFSRAAKEIAEAVILPLVAKNGRALPEETALRNLRNLTLVGYSAGTVFAQEMYNAAVTAMKKAGWVEDRARHALSEIVLISMAAVSRPSREKDRFTTLYLAGSNDLAVRLKNRIWRPVSRLFRRHSKALEIRRLSRTSLLVTAGMSGSMADTRRRPDGGRETVAIPPLVPPEWKIRSHHEMPHYLTCDDAHNGFSKIMLQALVNAIHRRERPDVAALLAPAAAQQPQEKTTYLARIDGAFSRGAQRQRRKKRGKHDQKTAGRQGFHAAALPALPQGGVGPGFAGSGAL